MTSRFLLLAGFILVFVTGCATSRSQTVKPDSQSSTYYKTLSTDQQIFYKADLYYNYTAGHYALLQHDVKRTIAHFAQAVRLDDDSAELLLFSARFNQALGNTDQAIEDAKKAYALNPNSKEAAILLGGLHIAKGDNDTAIVYYEEAVDRHPEAEELALFLAGAYQENNQPEKALRLLKKNIRQYPDSPLGNYELGKLHLLSEQYDNALVYLSHAVTLVPDFAKAHLAIGLVHEARGDRETAIKHYKQVLELSPEDNDLRNHVISLLIALDNPDEAIAENEKLKFFKHDVTQVDYNRAVIFFKKGDFDKAATEFRKVLENQPTNDAARYFLASCYMKMRDYDNAVDHFSKIDPSHKLYVPATEARAFVLRKVGRYKEARTLLEETIALYPKDVGLYRILSLVYSILEQHDEAIVTLKKAIELEPGNKDLIYTLANVYEKAGQTQKGIQIMEELLKQDPNDIDALNYIGYTLADHGMDLEKALDMVRRAAKLRPDDGYIADSVGWTLFQLGRTDEAVVELEKAVERAPHEPVILEHLGDAYVKAGRNKDALKIYIHARESHPEPDQIDRILQKIKDLGG